MKWLCIGAGSIGLLFAGKLAFAGADLIMATRTAEQADALKTNGLTIDEAESAQTVRIQAEATGNLRGLASKSGFFDQPHVVMLTVKQKDITDELLAQLQELVGTKGILLCFQNGIGHVERMARYIPESQIYAAVTTEGAKRKSATRVEHTGAGVTWIGKISMADKHGGDDSKVWDRYEKKLEQTFIQAGFRSSLSNQMKGIVWNKLLINAAINPLTALLAVRNGDLPRSDAAQKLMRLITEEGLAAAEADGVAVSETIWDRILEVCRNTARNQSSMLQDLSEGRRTEIDWINGAIVRTANAHGIPTPVNDTICTLIKAAEQLRSQ